MFAENVLEKIQRNPVVVTVVIDDAADAAPLGRALRDGGISSVELTLRTPPAMEALGILREQFPEMTVGAGTVLTREQVRGLKDRGVEFGVAPGLNPNVLDEAKRTGLSFAPGVATPSDVERALELGCRVLKFFPAEPIGGLPYLTSMAAPYRHLGLRFMPLGGISRSNMRAYLDSPLIAAVGGSWIAPRKLIQAGDWTAIRQLAGEATEAARKSASKEETARA